MKHLTASLSPFVTLVLLLSLNSGCSIGAADPSACDGRPGILKRFPDTTLVLGRDTLRFSLLDPEPFFAPAPGDTAVLHKASTTDILIASAFMRRSYPIDGLLKREVVSIVPHQVGEARVLVDGKALCDTAIQTGFRFNVRVVEDPSTFPL